MLRMLARREFAIQVTAGLDKVAFGVTLPSDTVVHGVEVKSTFAGSVEAATFASVFAVAFEMWILPILDPDAALPVDTIWDNLVPKDTVATTIDLDTAAIDVNNFFEPGEVDMSAIYDIGLRPQRVYHQHGYLTLANSALIVWQDSQSPFLLKFWPGGSLNFRLKRSFKVRQPSVLALAIASPAMGTKTSVAPSVLTEAQLPQVKYMRDVVQRGLMSSLGLVEAGAETPWEDAAALIKTHLDPSVYEQASLGTLQTAAWNYQGEASVDHSVTGEFRLNRLTTGR